MKYDGGSSDYVTFSIPKDLTNTDDIILKIDNGNYLVRKSTNYKYNDLPIASTTSLGGIIVGDNLTIDSNGKLNAQSGGSAATIQIGTTTTGEPGTDAQVTNSGTSSAAVFDFVIPRGEKGEQGATGQDGITPNIQVGTTTTLAAGSQATVTQRGTTTNPIFDFGIPKGVDGTGGGVTDYNDLTNKPVINLSSEDSSDPIVLYNLDEGVYILYGYIKYYPTYSGTTVITSPTLATVSGSSTTTYVQLLQPYGNKVIGYEITSNGYTEKTLDGGVTGDTLPIGSMIPYGSTTIPENWLLCNGQAISRTTYSDLFAVIGTSYGAGDGSTTFNLPNKQGRVSVGLSSSETEFNSLGKKDGTKDSHLQYVTSGSWGLQPGSLSFSDRIVVGKVGLSQEIFDKGNLQPYEVDCWIIKAFQSSGVVAEVSNTKSTSTTDTYSCSYINNLNQWTDIPVEWNNTITKIDGFQNGLKYNATSRMCIFGFTYNGGSNNILDIATIPEEYRPAVSVMSSGYTNVGNIQISARSDGIIRISLSALAVAEGANTFRGQIVWTL